MEKENLYQELLAEVDTVLGEETDPMAWMATLSCLIGQKTGLLWVGFYRVFHNGLKIGPYQGTLSCLHIPFERGVCGAAVARRKTVIVPNVHAFADHISCDSRSRSEIVVPIFDSQGELKAVLDLDSDKYDAFDEIDQRYLEQIASKMASLQWIVTN